MADQLSVWIHLATVETNNQFMQARAIAQRWCPAPLPALGREGKNRTHNPRSY